MNKVAIVSVVSVVTLPILLGLAFASRQFAPKRAAISGKTTATPVARQSGTGRSFPEPVSPRLGIDKGIVKTVTFDKDNGIFKASHFDKDNAIVLAPPLPRAINHAQDESIEKMAERIRVQERAVLLGMKP